MDFKKKIWIGKMILALAVIILLIPLVVAQCNDGLDNDGDGLKDKRDPGCVGKEDVSETYYGLQLAFEYNDGMDDSSCLDSLAANGYDNTCVEDNYRQMAWKIAFENPTAALQECLKEADAEGDDSYYNILYDKDKDYTKLALAECVYDNYDTYKGKVKKAYKKLVDEGLELPVASYCLEVNYDDYSPYCSTVITCSDDGDCSTGYTCDATSSECVIEVSSDTGCTDDSDCDGYLCDGESGECETSCFVETEEVTINLSLGCKYAHGCWPGEYEEEEKWLSSIDMDTGCEYFGCDCDGDKYIDESLLQTNQQGTRYSYANKCVYGNLCSDGSDGDWYSPNISSVYYDFHDTGLTCSKGLEYNYINMKQVELDFDETTNDFTESWTFEFVDGREEDPEFTMGFNYQKFYIYNEAGDTISNLDYSCGSKSDDIFTDGYDRFDSGAGDYTYDCVISLDSIKEGYYDTESDYGEIPANVRFRTSMITETQSGNHEAEPYWYYDLTAEEFEILLENGEGTTVVESGVSSELCADGYTCDATSSECVIDEEDYSAFLQSCDPDLDPSTECGEGYVCESDSTFNIDGICLKECDTDGLCDYIDGEYGCSNDNFCVNYECLSSDGLDPYAHGINTGTYGTSDPDNLDIWGDRCTDTTTLLEYYCSGDDPDYGQWESISCSDCSEGVCSSVCTDDSDCYTGYECDGATCVEAAGCDDDSGCSGYICDTTTAECSDSCTDDTECDTGYACDTSSNECTEVTMETDCSDGKDNDADETCDTDGCCSDKLYMSETACVVSDGNTWYPADDDCSTPSIPACLWDEIPSCGDGVDNDADGLIDLDDEDCSTWSDREDTYQAAVTVLNTGTLGCGETIATHDSDSYAYNFDWGFVYSVSETTPADMYCQLKVTSQGGTELLTINSDVVEIELDGSDDYYYTSSCIVDYFSSIDDVKEINSDVQGNDVALTGYVYLLEPEVSFDESVALLTCDDEIEVGNIETELFNTEMVSCTDDDDCSDGYALNADFFSGTKKLEVATAVSYNCSDELDNDGDGYIDYLGYCDGYSCNDDGAISNDDDCEEACYGDGWSYTNADPQCDSKSDTTEVCEVDKDGDDDCSKGSCNEDTGLCELSITKTLPKTRFSAAEQDERLLAKVWSWVIGGWFR
jgi:hypothetical protein